MTVFLFLYVSGYASVSSIGENGGSTAVEEVEKSAGMKGESKHFLLQPPGESNGNVLPGSITLDSKTFENEKGDATRRRDDNVLPGAIGLIGAFDESEPAKIMGDQTADSKPTEEEKAPSKKTGDSMKKQPPSTSTKKSPPERQPEKKEGKRKRKRKRTKKPPSSNTPAADSTTTAPTFGSAPKDTETAKKTTEGKADKPEGSGVASSPSDDSDKKGTPAGIAENQPKKEAGGESEKASNGTSDVKHPKHSKQAKDVKNVKESKDSKDSEGSKGSKAAKSKSKDSKPIEAAPQPPGPLFDGPHPMNRQMAELQVPGDTENLDEAAVRGHYEKLVDAYLAPFSEGIARESFFKILKRRTYSLAPPGSNKGIQTLLFQLHDKSTSW